jgi:hypothetical protein
MRDQSGVRITHTKAERTQPLSTGPCRRCRSYSTLSGSMELGLPALQVARLATPMATRPRMMKTGPASASGPGICEARASSAHCKSFTAPVSLSRRAGPLATGSQNMFKTWHIATTLGAEHGTSVGESESTQPINRCFMVGIVLLTHAEPSVTLNKRRALKLAGLACPFADVHRARGVTGRSRELLTGHRTLTEAVDMMSLLRVIA